MCNIGGKNVLLYVIGINETTNQLFVGEGEKHPGLWTNVFAFSENQIQFQNPELNNNESESGVEVRIHSTVKDIDMIATLYLFDGILYIYGI